MKIRDTMRPGISLKRRCFSFLEPSLRDIGDRKSEIGIAVVGFSLDGERKNGFGILKPPLRRVGFCEIQGDINGIAQLHCTLERGFSPFEVAQEAVTVAEII